MGRLARGVLVLLTLAFLAVGGFFLIGLLVLGTTADVESGTWLEVRFTGSYPEQRPSRTGLRGALTATDISAQDLLTALDRARRDARVGPGRRVRGGMGAGG